MLRLAAAVCYCFLGLSSVALVTPASARDYDAVGAFGDWVEYLDRSTVKTDGEIKTFWTNIVFIRTNASGFDWMSQYESVDCVNHRLIMLNVIGYRMDGTVVGQSGGSASIQPYLIDIRPETEAAATEDAVCHGNILGTDSSASFLAVVPMVRRRMIKIAVEHPQSGEPMRQAPSSLPAWRSTLRLLGRALQQASSPPPSYSSQSDPVSGQPVYSPSECVGPIVAGVCHGAILPNQATHPVCHGEMLNGVCTGPMF